MNPSLKTSAKAVPASLGFKMPPEWAPHEATWLTWPKNLITWPEEDMRERVEQAYVQIIRALLPGEKVHLLVDDGVTAEKVRGLLHGTDALCHLAIHQVPTVDSWIRDYGPTFLLNGEGKKAYCKWIFNAWGGKYEDLMRDNEVFVDPALAPYPRFDACFVLEGGSIEVNGAGTCMTSEQCLLNPNRNPAFSRADVEQKLRDYLGVSEILWLKEGIVGDDTDGHIDDIARFAGPNTIVAAYEDNESDPNHAILKENWEILQSSRNAKGGKWDLIKIPMPKPVMAEGEPLPASYANFYIGNKVVLLPVFDDPNDFKAAGILKEVFPGREIVLIPARDMVYGLGTVHCLSQQEPA